MKSESKTDLDLLAEAYARGEHRKHSNRGWVLREQVSFFVAGEPHPLDVQACMYNMDTIIDHYHKLSGKPKAWSDASPDDRWLAQTRDGCWWWIPGKIPVPNTTGGWTSCEGTLAGRGKVLGDYRDTLEERDMITNPRESKLDNQDVSEAKSQPKWNGPEDGLPPLYFECEFSTNAGYNWCQTELKYKDGTVFLTTANQLFKVGDPDISFRPIKTERERVIEKMVEAIEGIKCETLSYEMIARNLYDQVIEPMREGE